MTVLTLEDEIYCFNPEFAHRSGLAEICVRVVIGDDVRDFQVNGGDCVLMPQMFSGERRPLTNEAERYLWPWRMRLARRLYFGQVPEDRGLRWFDLGMFFAKRHTSPLSITYAEVATHNHFVLDRGGKVFRQTAPVIKLPESATDAGHLALLAVLNSSSACFWLKQMCHCKGSTVDSQGARQTTVPWEDFYQFNSKRLALLPLPLDLPQTFGWELDGLASRLSAVEASAVRAKAVPTRAALDTARTA